MIGFKYNAKADSPFHQIPAYLALFFITSDAVHLFLGKLNTNCGGITIKVPSIHIIALPLKSPFLFSVGYKLISIFESRHYALNQI
jgi:hypothetical protein